MLSETPVTGSVPESLVVMPATSRSLAVTALVRARPEPTVFAPWTNAGEVAALTPVPALWKTDATTAAPAMR